MDYDNDITTPTDSGKPPRLDWAWGLSVATVLVVIYVPATIYLRRVFDLPMPDPVPAQSRSAAQGFSPRYWLIWLISWLVLISPGVVLLFVPRTRPPAVAYLLCTGLLGGAAAAAIALFEYNGFAPN